MKLRREEKLKEVSGKKIPFVRVVCKGHARSMRRNKGKCAICNGEATGWVKA